MLEQQELIDAKQVWQEGESNQLFVTLISLFPHIHILFLLVSTLHIFMEESDKVHKIHSLICYFTPALLSPQMSWTLPCLPFYRDSHLLFHNCLHSLLSSGVQTWGTFLSSTERNAPTQAPTTLYALTFMLLFQLTQTHKKHKLWNNTLLYLFIYFLYTYRLRFNISSNSSFQYFKYFCPPRHHFLDRHSVCAEVHTQISLKGTNRTSSAAQLNLVLVCMQSLLMGPEWWRQSVMTSEAIELAMSHVTTLVI